MDGAWHPDTQVSYGLSNVMLTLDFVAISIVCCCLIGVGGIIVGFLCYMFRIKEN